MKTADPYCCLVNSLDVGKRLPESTYLHVSFVREEPKLDELVCEAQTIANISAETFNVCKFSLREPKISLLHYPHFFEQGFPVLYESWSVHLVEETVRAMRFNPAGNAPVLHRKELLLSKSHPDYERFQKLTFAAETMGLLKDVSYIGHRHQWEEVLRAVGCEVKGHSLHEIPPDDLAAERINIRRHQTAIHRKKLSSPMQLLLKHGYLNGDYSVFDFGCGRGGDVSILTEHGLDASGWDPYFAPDEPRQSASIVNLGFVLNVIEDVNEREATLREAFSLARDLLVVSVMLQGDDKTKHQNSFSDGHLTSRKTFQKYFSQNDMRNYLINVLDKEPVAVGAGVFFVFAQPEPEQEFLAAKQSSLTRAGDQPSSLFSQYIPLRYGPQKRTVRTTANKWKKNEELVEEFWSVCLQLGRVPRENEFPRSHELVNKLGRPSTVLRHSLKRFGPEDFEVAEASRTSDLLVFLALNMFEERSSFKRMPQRIQDDIKAFFGSYRKAISDAKMLLFSVGQPQLIQESVRNVADLGVGFLIKEKSFTLRSSMVKQMPPLLRMLIGCAEVLFGEIDSVDLVKIKLHSLKISLLKYDDFPGKALPLLVERTDVDLRRLSVASSGSNSDPPKWPLYYKSRYLQPEDPQYQSQIDFEKSLDAILELGGDKQGPNYPLLCAYLKDHKRRIVGYSILED
jgi:DNA phosphorothioation-associated putative methyltransferase